MFTYIETGCKQDKRTFPTEFPLQTITQFVFGFFLLSLCLFHFRFRWVCVCVLLSPFKWLLTLLELMIETQLDCQNDHSSSSSSSNNNTNTSHKYYLNVIYESFKSVEDETRRAHINDISEFFLWYGCLSHASATLISK